MRIVYLNPSGRMGGAEVALLSIFAVVREAQPEWPLALIVSDEGPLADRSRELGLSISVLPFPASVARIGDASVGGLAEKQFSRLRLLGRLMLAGPGIAAYILRLRKTIRRLNPDVIQTNGFKMHILGALARPAGTPLIWHIHDYVSSRPFMARLIKLFRKRCSLVIANSDSVKRDIESLCGNGVKVRTIYNAVDTSEFSPDGPRLDLDELSGLVQRSQGAIVRVGLLATFGRWKGHEIFLRALSLLPADIAWRGYVIGSASYQTDGSQYSMEELKSLAQDFGISNRVGFTGFVEQPAAALRSLDIVVHASTQPEPFGLVIIEAMATGRAVIVSDAGGAAELIRPNGRSNGDAEINALGHAPGDVKALAERITQLANNPHLRWRLGEAGRETAERRFDRGRLQEELMPIYRSLSAAA